MPDPANTPPEQMQFWTQQRSAAPEAPAVRPVATYVLLALNVLVFGLMTVAGGSQNPEVLLNFGASYAPYFHRGEYWRLVMPMFLHIGVLHLLINMYGLYLLGRILEPVYGYGRFSVLYVGSGMASSYLSMAVGSHIAAGASGAIFGIAGAMLTAGFLHRASIPRRLRRVFGSGILIMVVGNLVFGMMIPGIDNWGHIGGLFGGMVLAGLIKPPAHEESPGGVVVTPSQFSVIVPIAVVALAMAAALQHYRTYREVSRMIQEGGRLLDAKQPDRAVEQLRQAGRRDPRDERPHEELGVVYLRQGKLAEAIREFQEAVNLNPDSMVGRLGLAQAYQQAGDPEHARENMARALRNNPKDASGQAILADVFMRMRLYPHAIQHYQEALKMDPKLAEAHNNLAWLYATCDDPRFRNPKSALEHAQKAVDLSEWKEPNFIDTLAEAYFVNGNYGEAVRTQSKALKLAPDNQEFQQHMEKYRKAAGTSYTFNRDTEARPAAGDYDVASLGASQSAA